MYTAKKISEDVVERTNTSMSLGQVGVAIEPVEIDPAELYEITKITVRKDENGNDVNIPEVVAQTSLDELNGKLATFQGMVDDVQTQIDAINGLVVVATPRLNK